MRRRNIMTGLDMEQNSQSFVVYPQVEPYVNNLVLYGPPQYHHPHALNLGPGMSTAPNFYLPYVNYHAPASHSYYHGNNGAVVGVTSTEHERNGHFMDHGYKTKFEVVPGSSQYPNTAAAAAPSSFPQLNTHDTGPVSFTNPQPLDHRIVRNGAGQATMNPLVSHGHNNFIQGNYAAHPLPPPGSVWYDQNGNGHRLDGSSTLWSQAPFVPYMPGNVVPGSIDSGNVCFPRYHETSNNRNPTESVYPMNHYISYHPAPPLAIVYTQMLSASYNVPQAMHAASYSHVGPVQSTGFRINQQYPRENFSPAEIQRLHEYSHLRATPADELALSEVGDVDDHQDMRLDIGDMSYEELLNLSEQIGTVKTGLSEEDVKDLLKGKTSLWTTNLETAVCTICQENYENEEKIATLDCKHEYHEECLKKWLGVKNNCPICKSEALVMEKKKKLELGEEVSADST